jgi:2-iminobutanoate/2-iminopropanoate deaminase
MKKQFALLTVVIVVLFASCRLNRSLVVVSSRDAPKAIGPYSQAIKTGDMIFTSGQIGLSPATGALVGDDITAQTQQALKNINAVLENAGSDMAHVVKATIFLKDLNDYATVNDIYKTYFPEIKPARSTVQVSRLPKDALIEIECTAVIK